MTNGQPANALPLQDQKPSGLQNQILRLCSVQLSRGVRLVAPRLADALADGIWLAAWPFGGWIVLGALAIGFLFPLLWPGMHIIYSESLLFLLLVVAAAYLNGCLAVMLLFGYAAGDIVHVALGNLFSASNPLPTLAGHLVGYAVLGIAAVVLPGMARSMARQLTPKTANPQLGTLAEAGLFGLAAGVLTYAWCQGAVVLLRPIFTWAGGSPIREAIVHVQQEWPWLVAVAVIAALAKPFLEQVAQRSPSGVLISQWKQETRASAGQRRRIPAPVRLLATSFIATFVLAGTYAGWLDALLVFGTTLGLGAWRSGLIGHFPAAWTQPISRIPVLLRFILGLIVGYILSSVVLAGVWQNTSSLRPVMFGALLTLAVLYVLLPKPRPNGGPGKPGGFKWVSPSGVLLLLILLTPAVAMADNCSSLSDCWPTAGAAAAAAAGAGAVAAASAGNDSDHKPDPCAGYQRGYDQEKALLDTIDAQRQSKADAYNNALPQLAKLLAQFKDLSWGAMNTLKEIQELSFFEACAALVADLAVEAIAPELGIGEAVEGQPTAVFHLLGAVAETGELLQNSSGNLEQMREWALNNAPSGMDVTAVLDLVNVGEQMQELTQKMIGLKNQYDAMQDERDTEAAKVADAKAALDACRASQG
jgi:hypothetical protein